MFGFPELPASGCQILFPLRFQPAHLTAIRQFAKAELIARDCRLRVLFAIQRFAFFINPCITEPSNQLLTWSWLNLRAKCNRKRICLPLCSTHAQCGYTAY